jgi:hypothetical protein
MVALQMELVSLVYGVVLPYGIAKHSLISQACRCGSAVVLLYSLMQDFYWYQ